MLVLTRKIGQQIVLPGCGVSIDVIEVGKNQVRLGITAPAEIPVHRSEVWDRVRMQPAGVPGGAAKLRNQVPALAEEREGLTAAEALRPDLDRCLTEWIAGRVGGRIANGQTG